MSQSKTKAYRRQVKREVLKDHRKIIFQHMDNLCVSPLRVRLQFAWRFVRGINPHTGKRPSNGKN